MVTAQNVLDAIVRGIEQSGRLPADVSYLSQEPDPRGTSSWIMVPAVVVQEVSTVRDDSRVTDLVGYITDDEGSQIGRIWQASYEMEVQIDVHTAAGADPPKDVETLERRVQRALQRYDSQMRQDSFPDGEGGFEGGIREFTLGESHPENDLTQAPSLMRQRLSAFVSFVDRLNEVEEYGPLPTIKRAITPRDGDFVGSISDDYDIEFHPDMEAADREPEFSVTETEAEQGVEHL